MYLLRSNWGKDYKCTKYYKTTNIPLFLYDSWVRGRHGILLTLRGSSVPTGNANEIIKYIYIPKR